MIVVTEVVSRTRWMFAVRGIAIVGVACVTVADGRTCVGLRETFPAREDDCYQCKKQPKEKRHL